jgi:pimeloyl-ACP methyl ester carboxylesterase
MLDLNALPHTIHNFSNRRGAKLFVRFNGIDPAKPLALVAHGFSDVHDSAPIRAITSGLIKAGYNVVTWDATNSWGRSDGSVDRATLTGMVNDMDDVIEWAGKQPWHKPKFVLAGHSLGAAAALTLAVKRPEMIERLILSAPVVSGRLLAQRLNPVIRLVWRIARRLPDPHVRGKFYRYDLLRDGLAYDGRILAKDLQVPTTLIVAGQDHLMPPEHIQQLYDAITAPKQLVTIAANHFFAGHLDELETSVYQAAQSP